MPISRSRAPVAAWISGHARSSVGSPLRGSWRPMKTTVWSRFAVRLASGIEHAVRDDRGSPAASHRAADSAAIGETAMRASIRSIRKPQKWQPSTHPAEVAVGVPCDDDRALRERRASRRRPPASSARAGARRRSCSSARIVLIRPTVRGERTMFGSEPLAGTTTERPTAMIPSGSGAVPPGARVQEARELAPAGRCPSRS